MIQSSANNTFKFTIEYLTGKIEIKFLCSLAKFITYNKKRSQMSITYKYLNKNVHARIHVTDVRINNSKLSQ